MYKKMEQVNFVKVLKKYSKLKLVMNLNRFNDAEIS